MNSVNFILDDEHCYGRYIIGEFNLNGIKSIVNPYNVEFKKYVLSCIYFDILILPEHHCLPNESFELEKYQIFQNNRPTLVGGARRGSGGIAIAINNDLIETHTVVSMMKGADGQMSIKLKNNCNDFLIGVLALYLPPYNYIYGKYIFQPSKCSLGGLVRL